MCQADIPTTSGLYLIRIPLGQAEDGDGDFLLADFGKDDVPDLYLIKRRYVGTNNIESSCLRRLKVRYKGCLGIKVDRMIKVTLEALKFGAKANYS